MTSKPILRWPGGKRRLLKHLLPLIRPHKTYVEGFAGGLALLLAKERSRAEIVNDLNSDVVNLYRHAQYHLDALVAEVEWTVNSRQNLVDLIDQPGLTGLQQAARFLLRNRMSFGGKGVSYAVSRQAPPSRAGVLEALREFSARMDKVSVECLPYERLLPLYDGPETFWFLDPPYTQGRTENYDVWTEAQMTAFAAAVQQLKGDWIVTVNDCPHNRALFASHTIKPVKSHSGGSNSLSNPGATFEELIIQRKSARLHRPLKAAEKRFQSPLKRAA